MANIFNLKHFQIIKYQFHYHFFSNIYSKNLLTLLRSNTAAKFQSLEDTSNNCKKLLNFERKQIEKWQLKNQHMWRGWKMNIGLVTRNNKLLITDQLFTVYSLLNPSTIFFANPTNKLAKSIFWSCLRKQNLWLVQKFWPKKSRWILFMITNSCICFCSVVSIGLFFSHFVRFCTVEYFCKWMCERWRNKKLDSNSFC